MTLASKVLAAAFTLALASQGADKELPFEFGKLRATLNGQDFSGVFGRDSTVAIWTAYADQLQIEGDKRSRGRRPERVRITLRCGGLPKAGTYAISDFRSPVSAAVILAPTRWERIWPLRGARYRAFLSDSTSRGTLVLETDSAKAIVKGHFSASLRNHNSTPAETLSVRGTFFGRLYLRPDLFRPGAKWAPGMRTDCERIRDAVSM